MEKLRQMLPSFMEYVRNTLQPVGSGIEACGPYPQWTSELWTLETARALYFGMENYLKESRPDYLEGVDFHLEGSEASYKHKFNLYNTLDRIKNDCNNLFICEVGRGLEILIALSLKDNWNITCYDAHYKYEELIQNYFNFPSTKFKFFTLNSNHLKSEHLTVPSIVIYSHMRGNPDQVIGTENVKYLIKDGTLI